TTSGMVRGLDVSCRVLDIDGPREKKDYFRGWIDIRPSTLASINFTSGTTGRPRGVMLSHRNYLAACRNFLDNFPELQGFGRVLHVLPFHHSTAALLLPAIACGISSAIAQCEDAAAVLDAADLFEPDVVIMHPDLIGRILDRVKREPGELRKLRSLQTVFYGSSSINASQIREAMERIGPVFAQAYGMTEALPPVAVLDRDDHARALECRQHELFSSCGKPARGVDVKIVDDSGGEIGGDEPGELLVRGGNVMEGYLGMREETLDFLRDGWAHTGDMAKRKKGYLYLMGRKRDLINRAGLRIFPQEIESIVAGVDGVKDCAVFAMPDEKEGEVPACAVVLEQGRGGVLDALRIILAGKLPAGKMPVEIIGMDRLPRSSAGKVDRNMIRRSVAPEGGEAGRTR
ncbi:MAG: fatty acid--CoA ligase family protein, partial [Pseudomonadota bacterium]